MKLIAWYSKANPFGGVLTEEQIYGSWELKPFGESSTLHATTLIKATDTLALDVVSMSYAGGKCGICLRRQPDPTISAMGQGDGSAALAVFYPEINGYINLIVASGEPTLP